MHSIEVIQPSTTIATTATMLKTLGRQLVEACPDMLEMAREAAKEILAKHTRTNIEPDQVYWHRFTTSMSSPRTFSGWQHVDAPIESLTLTELVMRRFNAHDQDNVLDLQVIGGFYDAGPSASIFNESNEVRLLPADVLKDLWQINFSARYNTRLISFWQSHADDFRSMAKANFLAKALEERDSGRLSATNLSTVIKAVCGEVPWPITLQTLRCAVPADQNLKVFAFDIAGYVASNILRIVDQSGRQLLYVPGDVDAFHVFETPDDLQWWVMSQTSRAPERARFMAHFPLSSHLQRESAVGLNHMIDVMFSQWGAPGPKVINQTNQIISGDAITWLRDSAKSRMIEDAFISLHSNGDLRKQMWIGSLSDFSTVAGALAALYWPLALVAVGANVGNIGLNIDQAINGHNTAERKAGVIGAILSSVDALFNGLPLTGHAAPLREIEATVGPTIAEQIGGPLASIDHPAALADLEALAPGPIYAVKADGLLAPFETNVVLTDIAQSGEGRMRGISVEKDGTTYISIDGFAYAVRYVGEIKSWVIVDPANPFSFYRNLPVQLNALGKWEPCVSEGLKGGGKVLGKLPWGRASVEMPVTQPVSSSYNVLDAEIAELRATAQGADKKVLSGERRALHPNWQNPYVNFKAIRVRLLEDATAFYAQPDFPPRPNIPALEAKTSDRNMFKMIFNDTPGLVIGESHSGIGSKQLLIQNMPQLAKLKVKTLYMEHLLTDFHQTDLDDFARTGSMPERLELYVKDLDRGHGTDPSGQYSFLALIKAANENHIRVRAIDCMASYRLAGMPDLSGTLRQKMMNYFARSIINADQVTRGTTKWLALVGDSHANTYRGVPGISEMEGVIGLRVEDVRIGESKGIQIDPGRDISSGIKNETVFVKSDLRVQMETRPAAKPLAAPEERLVRAGMFTVDNTADNPVLIHRSGDNTLVRTPIQSDRGHVYITRPKWHYLSGRRFDSVQELVNALTLMGMKPV